MKACYELKDGQDGQVIYIEVDTRIYDDDPIWEAVELVDGIIMAYKPKEIKKLLESLKSILKETNPNEAYESSINNDYIDRGSYKMQVLMGKMFKFENVCESLNKFFADWDTGKISNSVRESMN